jgi:dolichol-phosphate mannosyltransferase
MRAAIAVKVFESAACLGESLNEIVLGIVRCISRKVTIFVGYKRTLMRKLVIIPTYNERENIARMIDAVTALSEGFELLIVDDASPDGTAEEVRRKQQQYPERVHLIERSGKLGLGSAYITGFRWALDGGYDHIFEMDADFSHNPEDLSRLYREALEGWDVVIGSRYVSGVNVVNWPMSRLLMSYCASLYVQRVTCMPVHDATAGFICYSHEVLKRMNLDKIEMMGYGFQIEMKYTAWRLGFKIKELSIIFVDRQLGQSKMSSGIFSEAFWGVLRLRLRKIKGRS